MKMKEKHQITVPQSKSFLMALFLVLLVFCLAGERVFPATYFYDSLNRLTNVDYGNGSVISYTYDAAGNRVAYSGAVSGDATAPSISITSPTTSPSFTNGTATLNVSGTAADNVAVTLVTWANDRGGIGTATGTNIWSIPGIPLKYGVNNLSVTAYDAAGNNTTATLAVTFAPGSGGTSITTNNVFSDNFSGNVINSSVWSWWGNTVIQSNGTMEVETTVTDQPGVLTNAPFAISSTGLITITRRMLLHRDISNGHYFTGIFAINIPGVPLFSVQYDDYDYSNSSLKPTYGFFICRNGAGATGIADQSDVSPGITAIWDTWFNETITYDPATGQLQYYINNVLEITFNVGAVPSGTSPTMSFYFEAYGWWTGHEQIFSNLVVTQVVPAPLSTNQLTGISMSTNGMVLFNLNGPVGSNYVILVSSNLVNWLLFSSCQIPIAGSLAITDTNANGQSQRFYRALQSTFVEGFANAPNYTNNWFVSGNTGGTVVTYTSGNLRVQASRSSPYPPGSSFRLLSNDSFVGDVDYSVLLDHQGKGRTIIGLWSVASNNWVAVSALDTDDTDYLAFAAGSFSTDWKYAGDPYMNRWITLRIKTVGNVAQFYADGVLLESLSITASGPLQLGLIVSSVPWKSGDNDTSFRIVNAIGTKQ